MTDDLIFENTAFSVKHWARFSKPEFLQECRAAGFFSEYGPVEQEQMFELAFQLIQNVNNPA